MKSIAEYRLVPWTNQLNDALQSFTILSHDVYDLNISLSL